MRLARGLGRVRQAIPVVECAALAVTLDAAPVTWPHSLTVPG
jgi:hypothetical protein